MQSIAETTGSFDKSIESTFLAEEDLGDIRTSNPVMEDELRQIIIESAKPSPGPIFYREETSQSFVDELIKKPLSHEAKGNFISQLSDLAKSHQQPNWDGEGAQPIQEETVEKAKSLLERIAPISLPDISPEHSGKIGLSWNPKEGTMFYLTVSQAGEVNYAGFTSPENETYGKTDCSDYLMISLIRNFLRKIYS